MGTVLAIIAAVALAWRHRDRRSPEERLADALRNGDEEYHADHLPGLTEQENRQVTDLLLFELATEAMEGSGTGEWDRPRFERAVLEARRLKAARSLRRR